MPVRRTAAAILLAVAFAATAQDPTVVSIRFEGNETTREVVFLREIALRPGDTADLRRLEASRQAILDLGLFRSVEVRTEPADGGVAVVFAVREKRYFLPIPRLGASSDGNRSYGVQARWDNAWGLDHTLVVYAEKGEFEDDRLRESEDAYEFWYSAPYVFGETGVAGSVGYVDRIAPGPAGAFDETITHAGIQLFRDFREVRPRRGWLLNGGLSWRSQDTAGPFAPPPDGDATAFNFGATWSDVRFAVYSESGRRFSVQAETAVDGLASDYGYRRLYIRHAELYALPTGAHHNLNLIASAGWNSGGPGRVNAFSLGGASALRGYSHDFIEGERYIHAAAEYLRPVGFDWLRLLVVAEAGATGGDMTGARSGGPYASLGVGLRIRFTWFVRAELEFGVAWPLRGGDGMQVFAGGG